MKDELFDDLLKRKLDQEDQVVTSSEIDQVHEFVRQKLSGNPTQSWLNKYGFKLFTVSSILFFIGGSLYLVISNLELQNKSQILENRFNENTQRMKFLEENQKQLLQSNQILLTQNQQLQTEIIEGLKNSSTNKGQYDNAQLAVNVPQKEKKNPSKAERFAILQKKNQIIFEETAKNKPEKITSVKLKSNHGEAKSITNENGVVVSEKDVDGEVTNESQKDVNGEVLVGNTQQHLIDSLKVVRKSVVASKSRIAQLTLDSSLKSDSILEAKQNKKWIKSMAFSGGLTGHMGINERGGGLVGQVLVNHRWQLSAGLTTNHIGGSEFKDEIDYRNERNRNFSEEYTNRYSLSVVECRDIRFQYTIYNLPLNIAYVFPMKRKFELIIGLGTEINLKAIENVRFEGVSQPSNARMGHELNEVEKYMPVFSNMGLSFGVQKSWKRMVLQTMMYVNQSFEKTDIVRNLTIPGLRINFLYRLGQ